MYNKIIIRYGELWLKKGNKMLFIRKLKKNIQKRIEGKCTINFLNSFCDYSENNFKKLLLIPGLHSVSRALVVKTNESEIIEKTLLLVNDVFLTASTFKVEVKRNYKGFPIISDIFKINIANNILKNTNHKVSIHNPKFRIYVLIKETKTFIYFDKTMGMGGFPHGINGKVIHLISGGFDSSVAAVQMIKKGVEVILLNFITPPHTDQLTIDKVNRISQKIANIQGYTKLIQIDWSHLLNLISLIQDQSYKINLMRRSFYRIASKLAKKNRCLGISNGESIGQVASQTLESLFTIQSQTNYPVYRPLLCFDKSKIIQLSREYGFEEIAKQNCKESCELFAPKHPTTRPKIIKSELNEKAILENLSFLEEDVLENKIIIKNFKMSNCN